MLPKPNLDLLRAIAICLVVLDHVLLAQRIMYIGSWQSAWIGVVGVYWFFVHTSLVLMWSLQRKPYTLDFYIRRIFRIFPLAILVILLTVAFHAPLGGTPQHFFAYHTDGPKNLIANLLLLQNLSARGNNIVGVMWSLPLEIDMYLFLPVVFFFIRKNLSLWPLLLFWLVAERMAHVGEGNTNNFYTVIPCFLPGIMAYILFQRAKHPLPATLFPLFLLLVGGLFMHNPSVSASWPMCLLLGLSLPYFQQISLVPLVRIAHELAKYSYGIYLTHPFGLVIGFYLLKSWPAWFQISTVLLSTGFFSVVAYHAVEKPLIDLGARLAAQLELRYEQKQLAEVT